MLEVFPLITYIEKIASAISKLSDFKRKKVADSVLNELLFLYVNLGNLYDTAISLNDLIKKVLYEQKYNFYANRINNLNKFRKIILSRTRSSLLHLNLVTGLLDKTDHSEEFWLNAVDLGINPQRFMSDLVSIEENFVYSPYFTHATNKTDYLLEEFRLNLPIPSDENPNVYNNLIIDQNTNVNDPKIIEAVNKFFERESLKIIRECRKRLKEIIHDNWNAEDILTSLEKVEDFNIPDFN